MINVIRSKFKDDEVCTMAHSISTVQFIQCAGSDSQAIVTFVGEPEAEATYEDPFVIQQLRALTELVPSCFNFQAGDELAQLPFSSVGIVLYNNDNGMSTARVVLTSGLTYGLDTVETATFRVNYGKWLDRQSI